MDTGSLEPLSLKVKTLSLLSHGGSNGWCYIVIIVPNSGVMYPILEFTFNYHWSK